MCEGRAKQNPAQNRSWQGCCVERVVGDGSRQQQVVENDRLFNASACHWERCDVWRAGRRRNWHWTGERLFFWRRQLTTRKRGDVLAGFGANPVPSSGVAEEK